MCPWYRGSVILEVLLYVHVVQTRESYCMFSAVGWEMHGRELRDKDERFESRGEKSVQGLNFKTFTLYDIVSLFS